MVGKTKLIAFPEHLLREDKHITSDLLNLRLSLFWCKLVNEDMIEIFSYWNTPPYTFTPDLIVMGTIKYKYERLNKNYL